MMDPSPPAASADPAADLACLRWQVEMGADAPLLDRPAALATPATAPQPPLPHSVRMETPAQATMPPRPAPTAAAPRPARDLTQISTLDGLREAMMQLEGLSIRETAMNFVFGEGALHPPVMLIGEAPGEEEDRTGRPFVGRAGQMLEKMLAAVSRSREQVYIANVLPWRPPGNRTPKPDEVGTCLPYLMRHIELVAPKMLFLLGGPAATALLGKQESVTRLRGTWWDYHSAGLPDSIPALVTYHPAYLLRTPAQKRESWRDLRLLKKKMESV